MRVGQVDPVAHFLEEVGGPAPTIGRLEDHVSADRSGADLLGEVHRFVLDPDRGELVFGLIHPIDDRPSAVQVDAHLLLF
jgi:hypothetical protein